MTSGDDPKLVPGTGRTVGLTRARETPRAFLLLIRAVNAFRIEPSRAAVLVVCALCLAARFWIARYSIGSNDAVIWELFGELVHESGVLRAYELNSWFNHPPLMGFMATAARSLALTWDLPFAFVFKIPSLCASVAMIYALQRAMRLGWGWFFVLVLSPLDLMVGAYHGSTDVLCLTLCVGAVLAGETGRLLLSAFLLAAALNVKLIPVVLVAPFVMSLSTNHQRLKFVLALSVGVVPFVPVLFGAFHAFMQNAIFYKPMPALWGIGLVATGMQSTFPSVSEALWKLTNDYGKNFILLVTVVYALIQAVVRPVSRPQACAFALVTFLVFAPGFGIQYVVYPAPLLLLARRRVGFSYMYVAGAYASFLYYNYWTKTYPPYSDFSGWPELDGLLLGFGTWLVLAYFWLDSVREQAHGLRIRLAALLTNQTLTLR